MRFLRIPELVDRLGVSRTTLWRWERAQLLPPRRRIGPNSVGWLEQEIEEFLRNRPPVRSEPRVDKSAIASGNR